jgi:hypothetical protein
LDFRFGVEPCDLLQSSSRRWVGEDLENKAEKRQVESTPGIAVGSKSFIEESKSLLGLRRKGENATEGDERYQRLKVTKGHNNF